jgi:hypothetical protein
MRERKLFPYFKLQLYRYNNTNKVIDNANIKHDCDKILKSFPKYRIKMSGEDLYFKILHLSSSKSCFLCLFWSSLPENNVYRMCAKGRFWLTVLE